MKFKKLLPSLAAGLILAGCGADDNNSSNDSNRLDTTGPIYLVKTTEWVDSGAVSYHFLSNSLDETTEFDKDAALAIPEYTGILIPEGDNPDNAFYVGMKTSKVIRRYVVADNGDTVLTGEIDFTNVAADIGRNLLRNTQIMSATKAYTLDFAGLQVIAFNPTDMTLIDIDDSTEEVDTISLAHLDEKDAEPLALNSRWSVFPTTDGNRFIATMGFYGEYKGQEYDPGLTKLIVVDSANDTVTSDSVNNCSAVSGSAKDADGNMYFASYNTAALRDYLNIGNYYVPCVIRVLAGESEFDDTYFMEMKDLTETGRMAMGAVTGSGDIGYGLILSEEGKALIDNAPADELVSVASEVSRSLSVWDFYSFDLTNENATATKVQGVTGSTIGRMLNGAYTDHELGPITWVAQIENESDKPSKVFNTSNSATWSLITDSIPGQVEAVGRLK